MTNKIYLLTLVCLLTAKTDKVCAQNYLSLFGDSSTTWDVVLHGFCDAVCSQTITVTGDTTINSDTYKVISGLPGFVREDTVLGKAWFYDTYYDTEFLVMDLGLSLGDSFMIYNYFNEVELFSVDSVYYVSNKKHIRLTAWTDICSLTEKITFIEGSGTTASFAYQRGLNGNSVSSSMLCHHKNGVKVSGNILFNDICYECSVGIGENDETAVDVSIFPNPTYDNLTIKVKGLIWGNLNLTIYDLVGNVIHSQSLTGSMTTINVSDLSTGIYFAVVGSGNSGSHLKFMKY